MDTLNARELKQLAAPQAGTAVSLYLPTHPSGDAGMQDRIVLKKLVETAQAQLEARGLRRVEAEAFLAPAAKLPEDEQFWRHRSHGLGILLAPGLFRTLRMPTSVVESVTVGPRLNIKPLVAAAEPDERFLLLALSQNHVRLWEVTRAGMTEIGAHDIPENKREALAYDGADRGQQVHAGLRGGLGKQSAIYHGQGGEKDTAKADLEQFFRIVDRSLARQLQQETAPLLLAGVDYLLPIFRRVCSYQHLVERHLTGNCDALSSHQLFERSWEVMRPYFDRPRRQALERLHELDGSERASADPEYVVAAAASGKIDTLVADPNREQPGVFSDSTLSARLCDAGTPGSEDLVNRAVAETLLHGGHVFATPSKELPAPSPIAAIFRY